jgi:hypothetical protein
LHTAGWNLCKEILMNLNQYLQCISEHQENFLSFTLSQRN